MTTLDPAKSTTMICLTAGIGITPALCFAQTITETPNGRPLLIVHTARNLDRLAFHAELEKCGKIKYIKHFTQDKGRMQPQDITAIAQKHTIDDFFICGPLEFETMVKSALTGAGISESQIIIERFNHATCSF